MLKDWKSWCRLCAKCEGSDIDIFFKFETIPNMIDFLQKFFNLSINPEDGRPRTICENCFNLVTKLYKFSERCSKVEIMFSEFLYEQSNTVLSENDIQEIRNKFNLDIMEDTPDDVNMKMISDDMVCTMIKEETNFNLDDSNNKSTGSNDYDLSNEIVNFLEPADEPKPAKKKKKRRSISERNDYDKPSEKSQPVKCDQCEKILISKRNLAIHIKAVHGTNKIVFTCDKCPKTFTTKKSAKRHEITHLPPELKLTYPCSFCDKKFINTSNMYLHIRAIHQRDKPFVCEECGKPFSTKPALKKHQLVHTDEKPYGCEVCPLKFKSLPRLRIHEETHNDTKFVCQKCGLKLNTRQTLVKHMIVHSDAKIHKCQYCGNEYKRVTTLKNHLIVHTGLKPYVCQFCDKKFASGSNCRSHKKKAHPFEMATAEASGQISRVKDIPTLEQLQKISLQPEAFMNLEKKPIP